MPRTRSLVAVLGTAALVLAGCALAGGRSEPPQPVAASRTITVDSVQREYVVHVPATLAPHPSLVVFLHGGFGSADQAQAAYGWNQLADREGIVIAYPEGESAAWNAGSCCGTPARQNVGDVEFIAAVVDQLQVEFSIPAERTFATGMSNGALMAYRMACDTDVFAAIAPVAGTIVTPCVDPHPTSVLHIHGRDDERVRYDGETGSGVTRVDGLPVEDAVALWRTIDSCGEPTVIEVAPVTTSTSKCSDGRVVTLITIAGAGHQWPGANPSSVAGADAPSTAIDATELIWQFFDSTA